jgi:hypothetical protein
MTKTSKQLRVALYARVSTDKQSTENQLMELRGTAERLGWKVIDEFTDRGISGAKGRKDRPRLDAMLKGVARKDFDIVAAWSVDRLGRSLIDLVGLLQELHSTGVDLYLHQQGINTTTPAGPVWDDGCVRGIRTRHDRGACEVGPCTGQEERHKVGQRHWEASSRSQDRRPHPRIEGRGAGHVEDCQNAGLRSVYRAARGGRWCGSLKWFPFLPVCGVVDDLPD